MSSTRLCGAHGQRNEKVSLSLVLIFGAAVLLNVSPVTVVSFASSSSLPSSSQVLHFLNSDNNVHGEGDRGHSSSASLLRRVHRWTHHPRSSSTQGGLHPTLNISWPIKRVAELSGDLILGGLMMVHEREDVNTCGRIMPQGGVQALECMLYTIDWVNDQEDFLPGITLGAYILDDCDKDTYGLEQAVDFIKGSINTIDDVTYRCTDGSMPTIKQQVISGVLGAASSVTSIQVANLLRLFRIPQVSFFSTSPELSNKQRFEFFMRTVPSDTNQAQAMVEIIKKFNWTYVSVIYEESNYGVKAFEVLEDLLAKSSICLAVKEKLTKDSGVAQEGAYDNVVVKLLSKRRAKGVIVFASDQEVAELMRAIRRRNATGSFVWIGSDGWSARSLVSDTNELEVEGTLSLQPKANPVRGFSEYFLGLTPRNNKRNPWFIEYWEHYFNCKWPHSTVTPYNQNYARRCTGEEKYEENSYEMEKQLQFVSDAVLAFAFAFRDMHRKLCKGKPGLCPKMNPIDGGELLEYLRDVQFTGLSGDEFQFAENQDGPARYNVLHFKQVSPGNFAWVQVGEYEYGQLKLDMDRVQFRFEGGVRRTASLDVPRSVCSEPCGQGRAKKFVDGENCCWHCFNCTKYQELITETQCAECPYGFLPAEDQTRCVAIPEEYMRVDSVYSSSALVFSSVGVVGTLYVLYVFIKYQETPVVRASGRELCYVLLGGILMCYAMTFVLIMRPSDLICGIQQTGIGFSFTIVYSAILVKTNRISRIFNAGKKSAKRPSFISPKSQLGICSGMIFLQVVITVVWFAFSPPRAIHFYPTREDNMLTCEAVVTASHFIGFCYPIFLIVICTLYAVLTRKIPEAFNESKFIGFTMYTTCIIWLAFVPIYFTTSNHVVLNLTTMCVSISLSATVTLVCLFTPKLYIILLHPEKNVRQSMMTQHKYGTVTANHTSSLLTTNATANTMSAATASVRVESATQSEEYEMNEKLRSVCSLNSTLSKVSCGTQTNEDNENSGDSIEDSTLSLDRDKGKDVQL